MIATRRIRPASLDPAPTIQFQRGDVARLGEHIGVVAACAGGRVLLWPIRWRPAERAGDIPVDGWLDQALLENPRAAMIQTSVLMSRRIEGQRRVGTISPGLLRLVEQADARNADNQAVIRRWRGEREHRRDECAVPPKAI